MPRHSISAENHPKPQGSSSTASIAIVFDPDGTRVRADSHETLYEIARKNGVALESICGGKGTCGKCRIKVLDHPDHLSPITPNERRFLGEKDIAAGIRLACMTRAHDNVHVYVAPEHRTTGQRILETGIQQEWATHPWIKRVLVQLEAPTLASPRSVHSRCVDALVREGYPAPTLGLETIRTLASEEISVKGVFTVMIDATGHVWQVQAKDAREASYGIAFDIGTTTIVGYLVHLSTGETIAVESGLNPQVAYGEDVMSRITATFEDQNGLTKLRDVLHAFMKTLIQKLCSKGGIQLTDLDEIVVVGNTAMHHFFLGLDQHRLGLSPYAANLQDMVVSSARFFDLGVPDSTAVTVLPTIAGFIGADAIGVMVATRLDEAKKPTLAVDIGTNGEIMLGGLQGLLACSTAAGPAFEGAAIQSGMRGTKGAIEKVEISSDGEHLTYSVIGDQKPRGVCGSGIIDLMAEMLKTHLITPKGNFVREHASPLLHENSVTRQMELMIVSEQESATGKPLMFTQKDIREVQLAKGAIYAGQHILLKEHGETEADLETVLLAGAFGNYIRVQSAMRIGLLPDLPLDRIRGVGNAAGTGAKAVLMDQLERTRSIHIGKTCGYIELTLAKEFQRFFLDATYLPHRDLSLFPRITKELGIDSI